MQPDYLSTQVDTAAGTDPGAWGAHDPTVVRARDGRWLMFSTDTAVAGAPGTGAQVRQSDDLVTWRWFGHALDGVPEEAARLTGAPGIWAPEVVQRGDEFRMYYSASTFGSRTSVIGLATAPDATGPWTHEDVVVATGHDTSWVNAIDAAVVVDADGNDWLLYGSFFGGLRIMPLDDSGRPATPGDPGTPVVQRAESLHGAVEGGHALYDEESGTYALFCSFDSLFDTYHVRVARSEDVQGPYRGASGGDLVDPSEPPVETGTVILAGYEAPDGTWWSAPGHSSHLVTGTGRFLVHHVRDGRDPLRHTAHVRRLRWTRSGWPLASPLPYGGAVGDLPDDLGGEWLVYRLDPGVAGPHRPRRVTVDAADMSHLAAEGRGTVVLDGTRLDAVWFTEAGGVAVAGLDDRSVVVWGIRV